MLKYQIGLVVVGVAMIGWLYTRPKVIVKSNKEAVKLDQPKAASSKDAPDSLHNSIIPEEALSKIEILEMSFIKASKKEDKIRIADSLASIYKRNNRFDSAARYKELIAELSPELKNLENAGDMLSDAANLSANPDKVKDYSERARKYYEEILNKFPENLEVKSKLAMTYISTETPMTGIKMLREVVEKDPNNQLAIYNLGILAIQSKQYDKAAQRFEKLVDLNPENWKARFYLGMSYMELGDKGKAIAQFELVKKLEQDPEVISTINSYLEEMK